MIRLDASARSLDALERYGLDTLLDASCLLRVEDPDADVVELRIGDTRGSCTVPDAIANDWFIGDEAGRVVVERAAVRLVAEIVGAVAEQRSAARDRFDRVPSSENPLVAADAERDPVVSRAAQRLRVAAMRAAGSRPFRTLAPWPGGHRWAVALTHDLDVVEWWPAFTGLRIAELAKAREWRELARVAGSAVRNAFGDPVLDAVNRVLATEAGSAARSTWFLLCGTPTLRTVARGDLTYRPEAAATRRIVSRIRDGGHEIGLHGSFATLESAQAFQEQSRRLGALGECGVTGVRQHYLRMRPGTTHRAMEAAGFEYDATYGFPDRNGFRLGIADVVPRWDDASQRPSALREVPLTWMDRALSKYQGVMDPDRWIDDALALAGTVRDVGGVWVGLWHPNLATPLGFPRALDAYDRLVRELFAAQPWGASLSEIVAWRDARRAVRALRVDADGVVQLAPQPAAAAIVLENAAGERAPTAVTSETRAAHSLE
ncbi:MAG TPA: hypothetical protein VFO66_02220 [Gemmatimonadaceae bacterium]|nr:hypothetical protein [Gemmatimonadaceae bacterium]